MPELGEKYRIYKTVHGEPIDGIGADKITVRGSLREGVHNDLFIALGTDMFDPFQRGLRIEREADEWVIQVYDPQNEEPIQVIRLDANNHLGDETDA